MRQHGSTTLSYLKLSYLKKCHEANDNRMVHPGDTDNHDALAPKTNNTTQSSQFQSAHYHWLRYLRRRNLSKDI